MSLLILTSLLAALSVACVVAGFALSRGEKSVSERLDLYLASGDPDQVVTLKEIELSKPFSERIILPLAKRAARIFVWMLPQNRMNALRQRLVMAGNPAGISANDFVGVKGIVMTFVIGVALLFGYLTHYPLTFFNAILLGLLGFCSFALPDFWLSRQVTQRQTAITNSLPDALDLLVIANEAGLSFESGLQEITGKWNNELAVEFRHVLRDVGMGQARRDALVSLAERTGVSDVNSFVSAVNQAPVKMMFPLVFLIFPAIFAVLLGPAVPELLQAMGGL